MSSIPYLITIAALSAIVLYQRHKRLLWCHARSSSLCPTSQQLPRNLRTALPGRLRTRGIAPVEFLSPHEVEQRMSLKPGSLTKDHTNPDAELLKAKKRFSKVRDSRSLQHILSVLDEPARTETTSAIDRMAKALDEADSFTEALADPVFQDASRMLKDAGIVDPLFPERPFDSASAIELREKLVKSLHNTAMEAAVKEFEEAESKRENQT